MHRDLPPVSSDMHRTSLPSHQICTGPPSSVGSSVEYGQQCGVVVRALDS
ncbi:UNVERIFIED_CONTAM: hypothetical protein FKN15_061935 [Acipenser sinensis]